MPRLTKRNVDTGTQCTSRERTTREQSLSMTGSESLSGHKKARQLD